MADVRRRQIDEGCLAPLRPARRVFACHRRVVAAFCNRLPTPAVCLHPISRLDLPSRAVVRGLACGRGCNPSAPFHESWHVARIRI